MIASGYDADRRPLVDINRSKAACLDVRFATLKEDLLQMTGSALRYRLLVVFHIYYVPCVHHPSPPPFMASDYLMEKLTRRAAIEENAGSGCGIENAVMLTKQQIRKLLAQDDKLCLDPLQILSIMRSAKAHPIKNTAETEDGTLPPPFLVFSSPLSGPLLFSSLYESFLNICF